MPTDNNSHISVIKGKEVRDKGTHTSLITGLYDNVHHMDHRILTESTKRTPQYIHSYTRKDMHVGLHPQVAITNRYSSTSSQYAGAQWGNTNLSL